MRKPYGGGGGGNHKPELVLKKKKTALEQSHKLQGYLLLIKSNNACKTKSNM